jgi:hypothetical protein
LKFSFILFNNTLNMMITLLKNLSSLKNWCLSYRYHYGLAEVAPVAQSHQSS